MIIFLSLSQPKDTAMHHPHAHSAATILLHSELMGWFFFFHDLYVTQTWERRSFISLCQLLVWFFEEISESVWARLDSGGMASWPRAKMFNQLHFNSCHTQLGTAAAVFQLIHLKGSWARHQHPCYLLQLSSWRCGCFQSGLLLADAACFVQISILKCQTGMGNTANDAEINNFNVIIILSY